MARRRKKRYTQALDAVKSARDPTRRARRDPDIAAALPWAGLFVCSFFAVLFVAWHLLASANFLYGVWYDVLDIDQTVATYGPRNRYRQGFAQTDKREHQRLFGEIVTAVHNDGADLEALRYHGPQNNDLGSFLTDPEIVHLRDVAKLINKVNVMGTVALAIVLALLSLIVVRGLPPPSLVRFHISAAAVLAVVVALTLGLGAKETFYTLHEWVFPPDHQWFFFYRDSLMSTFMQAPNLFSYIAIALAVLTLVLYTAWIATLRYALRQRW